MSRLTAIILASSALLAAAAANAAPIYQAGTYGPGTASFTSSPVTFQGFDTSLGTLNSVQFNINNEQSVYTATDTNTGTSTSNDLEVIRTIITIGTASNTPAALNNLTFGTPIETFTFANLAAGQTRTVGPVTQGTSNATYFISPTALSQFENGAFSLTAIGSAVSFLIGTGSVSNSIVANGVLSLEYDYTPALQVNQVNPVPEPASMAVLGASLLGLGLARRRQS